MNTDFYGNETDVFSYLEFGAISPSGASKKVYDFYTNSKAYDWFMHARYSNDLVTYCRMIELLESGLADKAAMLYMDQIHHKDDFSNNLSKLIALSLFSKPSFFELGQTLFGCIEGIACCQKFMPSGGSLKNVRLDDVEWQGFDISDFFNTLAVQLHRNYNVTTTSDIHKIPETYSIFFAKGVTLLYAIRSHEDFLRIINSSDLMIFDYSLAQSKSELISIGTGKGVYYMSLPEFKAMVESSGKKMLIRKETNKVNGDKRVFIEGICGSQELVDRFIEKDALCRNSMSDVFPTETKTLLQKNCLGFLDWISIDSVCFD